MKRILNPRPARGSARPRETGRPGRRPPALWAYLLWAAVWPPAVAAETVHLYSARKEHLLRPLLEQFEQQSGIEVKLLAGTGDALLQRLRLEGKLTRADLFLAVDAARLRRARDGGLLRAVPSALLEQRVPRVFRDPEGHWYGLTVRARVIAYAPERVQASELDSYAALAEPGRQLCLRSSNHAYNQSLAAGLLQHWGAERTADWMRGLVGNLVRPPQGGDRDQLRAIAAGVCDLSLVNTYYHARMLRDGTEVERRVAARVALHWPRAPGGGTHVNLSGAGVTRHAHNPVAALQLLEFLAGPQAQNWFVAHNHEYPVAAELPGPGGDRLADHPLDLETLPELGAYNAAAVRLMDQAGWR